MHLALHCHFISFREEIQDFLNCIDASLEELQAMLSGKKFNFGSESFSDVSVSLFAHFDFSDVIIETVTLFLLL